MADDDKKKAVQRWADPAMFSAAPQQAGGPFVYVIGMTADPLGHIAAAASMYKGEVKRSLSEITDEERRYYLAEMQKTKLAAPLEFVNLHVLYDGVTRGFTHQLVRQRTAVYCQESTRFAVMDGEKLPVGLPPSLADTDHFSDPDLMMTTNTYQRLSREQQWRIQWDVAMQGVQDIYEMMVSDGMPAEDARGILPTNLLTRVHYGTNLRALLDHVGNRLCTQALFEWRIVIAKLAEAIRAYGRAQVYYVPSEDGGEKRHSSWQYEAIADLFKPVCYQVGRCPMKADFDRPCSIRARVDAYAKHGVSSDKWGNGALVPVATEDEGPRGTEIGIMPINPVEWLADPGAAR